MARVKGRLRIREAADALDDGARAGVGDALEHILQVSNTRVPLEEGPLQASGRVVHDGNRGAVSYGDGPSAAYAAVQHEHTEFRHSNGRIAKYLEVTLASEAAICRKIIGVQCRRAFKITG